jgi:hypothetical protein
MLGFFSCKKEDKTVEEYIDGEYSCQKVQQGLVFDSITGYNRMVQTVTDITPKVKKVTESTKITYFFLQPELTEIKIVTDKSGKVIDQQPIEITTGYPINSLYAKDFPTEIIYWQYAYKMGYSYFRWKKK